MPTDKEREPRGFQLSRRSFVNASAAILAMGAIGVEIASFPNEALATTSTPYQYPFPLSSITQNFGGTDDHRGTDFGRSPAVRGAANTAVASGVVVGSGTAVGSVTVFDFQYGNWVLISHADGMSSFYAHMLSPTSLAVGSTVSMGQTVGYVGNTGGTEKYQIGNHLHLGLTPTNTSNFQDPIPYIAARLGSAPPQGDVALMAESGITLVHATDTGNIYRILPNNTRQLITYPALLTYTAILTDRGELFSNGKAYIDVVQSDADGFPDA